MSWTVEAMMCATFRRKERSMNVMLKSSPKGWALFALESNANADTPDAVLENHAHQYLGQQSTLLKAIKTAEAYGKAWKREDSAAMAKCLCAPITFPLGPIDAEFEDDGESVKVDFEDEKFRVCSRCARALEPGLPGCSVCH